MKTISLQEISTALKVSKSTISYVLNGRGDEKRISINTQQMIEEYAKAHNYKPNPLARSLIVGKSNMIGFVLPNIADFFFARITRSIEKKAMQSGYEVVFSSTGEDKEREEKSIQSMLDRNVDGLIIASTQKNEKDILRLTQNKFPMVLIDRKYPDISTNFVGLNNIGGITMLVEHLINMGRKKIGFVSLNMDLLTLNERLNSYEETMKRNGCEVKKGFIQQLEYNHTDNDMERIIKIMLSKSIGVEGLIFSTQFLAADGIRALNKMNIKVPTDMAVVSYGHKNDFDLFKVPLTAIDFPVEEIGEKAVDILLENMKDINMKKEEFYFNTELIVRESCGSH
ncbi:LacI family transcriptional regulator [Seonamhaeicola sediminis]|uniref:LacI family transcriptional regulator n=1 Tax=Seonamhaeicola sediminis TaxID=2528206 RepID=A0A562YHX6_9FLAO|nr:LacI family DNA-binding transcriptional regulator [Seonamhaeicola sediminis]TWO34666.1 LacI family transcriptional regulator [Seonamhaeicola sediminis]